jgi:hypothetical protein
MMAKRKNQVTTQAKLYSILAISQLKNLRLAVGILAMYL